MTFLATFVVRLPTLHNGYYNPDETCYATIAQRLLEGKLLYLDIIDHKPPLLYFLYAIFTLLGGGKVIFAAHAAMVVIVAGTALMVGTLVHRLSANLKQATLAAVLYVVGASLGNPGDVAAANAELIFNLPLAASMLCVLIANESSREKMRWFVLSGFLAGIAVLIKLQAAVAPAAAFLFLVFDTRQGRADRLKNSAVFAASSFAPLLATAFYLELTGRLYEAWYWSVAVNALYVQGHRQGWDLAIFFLKQTGQILFVKNAGFWMPLTAWWILGKERYLFPSEDGRLIRWWFLASIVAIFPGLKFYGHYYLQILPPLCIAATFAGTRLISTFRRRRLASTIWLLFFMGPLFHSWASTLPTAKFQWRLDSVRERGLISYLKRHVLPGEKIEVWGRFNGIPFLVGRENGTRFLNKNLIAGSFDREELVKMPERHWELYFYDLERNKPEWFIDQTNLEMRNAPPKRFPRFASYISSNYRRIAVVDGAIVYHRE